MVAVRQNTCNQTLATCSTPGCSWMSHPALDIHIRLKLANAEAGIWWRNRDPRHFPSKHQQCKTPKYPSWAFCLDEERFEGRDGGAPYPDVDFDHGPEVDGDAVVEGVGRFGVDADGVEADDGGDAAEYAEAEDAD